MPVNTILNLPERFSIDLFRRKFNIYGEFDLTYWTGNRMVVHPDTDITDADILDCVADPAPIPPSVEERLEAAELFLGLLLDQEVTQ